MTLYYFFQDLLNTGCLKIVYLNNLKHNIDLIKCRQLQVFPRLSSWSNFDLIQVKSADCGAEEVEPFAVAKEDATD